MKDIPAQVIDICLEVIEMEPHEIGLNDEFRTFSHIDSLKALDLMTALEKYFQFKLPPRELREFETINKVIAVVQRHLGLAAAS